MNFDECRLIKSFFFANLTPNLRPSKMWNILIIKNYLPVYIYEKKKNVECNEEMNQLDCKKSFDLLSEWQIETKALHCGNALKLCANVI